MSVYTATIGGSLVLDLKNAPVPHARISLSKHGVAFPRGAARVHGTYMCKHDESFSFAAARLFVEEAGGRVTDCYGQPLTLAKGSLLATNGLLHEQVLEVLRRHAPGGVEGRAGHV